MLRTLLRRMPFSLKAALSMLLLAGIFGKVHALTISWNADDLRGVWVMTCPVVSGTTDLGTFYVQFSLGGAANSTNTTLSVLGGGTYQEATTRSVTGGSFSVSAVGVVTGSMTLVNPNAVTSTFALTGTTAMMGQDKNTVTAIAATDTAYNGATIGATSNWASMTKISDQEVRDGNSAGQACFLSSASRR